MTTLRQQLIDELSMPDTVKPEFILFWGHTVDKDGIVSSGKTCFSQWYPSPIIINNIMYPTAEHFMMAEKAKLFGDLEIADKVMEAETPKDAKILGRQVKNFNKEEWEKHAFNIVVNGNTAKFTQHVKLMDYLLSTGNKIIVEASPYDVVWGIGMGQDNPDCLDPEKWKGENLLGFALMVVRDKLRG